MHAHAFVSSPSYSTLEDFLDDTFSVSKGTSVKPEELDDAQRQHLQRRYNDSLVVALGAIAKEGIRTQWGVQYSERPEDLFSEITEGIVGFQDVGESQLTYVVSALEELLRERPLESFAHHYLGEDSYVITFTNSTGTTLHITHTDKGRYVVHAYSKKLTEAAKRRVAWLDEPTERKVTPDILQISLFDQAKSILGIENANASTILQDKRLTIVQTTELSEVRTAVLEFLARDTLERMHMNADGSLELYGSNRHRLRIEKDKTNQYTVYGIAPQLSPFALSLTHSLKTDPLQEIVIQTFYPNKPTIRVPNLVEGWGVHVWYGTNLKESTGYHVSTHVLRGKKLPLTYQREAGNCDSTESTSRYIQKTVATLLASEFNPNEGEIRELDMRIMAGITGDRYYDKGRLSLTLYKEIHPAYCEGIADGIVAIYSGSVTVNQSPSSLPNGKDAGDLWFEQHMTKQRQHPPQDDLIALQQRLTSPTPTQCEPNRDQQSERPQGRQRKKRH